MDQMQKDNHINKDMIYNKLEQDVVMLNQLFTDINYLVTEQGEYLDSIENNISISKQDVEIAHQDIQVANQTAHSSVLSNITNLKFSTIGATIGAVVLIYNPYIAIGTIFIGGIVGWTIGDKLQQNSIDIQENKEE